VTDRGGALYLIPIDGGPSTSIHLGASNGYAFGASWSPDGEWVVFSLGDRRSSAAVGMWNTAASPSPRGHREEPHAVHHLIRLTFVLALTGCAASTSTTTEPPPETTDVPASVSASADPTESPSTAPIDADGTFLFTPAVIDCPDGCPTSSISEALGDPGMPGIPMLVDGAILVEPDGTAWLCEGLTDASPPECDGARLRFENIDLYAPSMELQEAEELDGVRWIPDLTLPGEVTPAD
jgi:hypothetical protein